jgi:hypothetical protein
MGSFRHLWNRLARTWRRARPRPSACAPPPPPHCHPPTAINPTTSMAGARRPFLLRAQRKAQRSGSTSAFWVRGRWNHHACTWHTLAHADAALYATHEAIPVTTSGLVYYLPPLPVARTRYVSSHLFLCIGRLKRWSNRATPSCVAFTGSTERPSSGFKNQLHTEEEPAHASHRRACRDTLHISSSLTPLPPLPPCAGGDEPY